MTQAAQSNRVRLIDTPIAQEQIESLRVGDQLEINGRIFCGRDAVLPKIVRMVEDGQWDSLGIDLQGSAIFHTAVSPAGIGPTTSNKVEIEGSIPALSQAGVKLHIGKGALSAETSAQLQKYGSIFAITPPVSALFGDKIVDQRVAAFPEEGMEALFELTVKGFPAIVAIAHGQSIF